MLRFLADEGELMELEGKIGKSGKFWLIEVRAVDVMTQGYSRKEALYMLNDAITGLIACYFPNAGIEVQIKDYKNGTIGVFSSNDSLMQAFSQRRKRCESRQTSLL